MQSSRFRPWRILSLGAEKKHDEHRLLGERAGEASHLSGGHTFMQSSCFRPWLIPSLGAEKKHGGHRLLGERASETSQLSGGPKYLFKWLKARSPCVPGRLVHPLAKVHGRTGG